ncbi:MAG: T9SS type A sorting domain-containing protein [Ignavibacteria bacterium]|nr:T9SS type A sorting domain-containing protein [Ignavibacteria bacterium]
MTIDGSTSYKTGIKNNDFNEIPQSVAAEPGTHTFKMELYENFGDGYGVSFTSTHTIYVKNGIIAQNNFSDGVINLEGNQVNVNGTANKVYKLPNESVSVGAINQQDGDYWMLWNSSGTNLSNWKRNDADIYGETASSLSYAVTTNDNGAVLKSDMKKLCSLTFQAAGSTIYINSVSKSSPTVEAVVEQNVINAAAGDYISNGIEYLFSNWTYEGGTASSTITPDAHGTYTAQYTARAVPPTISFGTTVGQPVVINWTDNPNSNVTQYRIHRRIYQNGVWSADAVIATVNSGVESYTDYDFNLSVWHQNILLEYGITAYYSVNSTWSQGGANTQVYCTIGASMQSNDLAMTKTESEVPVEFAISNYPNPFNPATTINYQLPKDGMVTIKIYDVLGKEVVILVNEQKSAGYYKVDFYASKLTSGVYICSIQSNSFSKSIKLLLTK